MFRIFLASLFTAFWLCVSAQVTDPMLINWKLNTTGHTAAGILTGVERVDYTPNDVFITTSGVPWYYDPNNSSVNKAKDKDFVFRLPRTPQQNTGTPTSTFTGGQMGIYLNGSPFYNPEDARSYQNANVWHQLAYYFEKNDFDTTWGHSTPAMGGNVYHHHVIDRTTASRTDGSQHSPLIGFAFDGYPVYGPFGYTNATDPGQGISRMTPSYQLRNISDRTTLPDGTVLQASQYGPGIGGQYPLGCYREDYTYTAGSGTLDDHNGRFCKKPEYPNGTYAYFATVKADGSPEYPYHLGHSYYGVVANGNTGPNGGKFTVPGGAVKYVPSNTAITHSGSFTLSVYPNPCHHTLYIEAAAPATFTLLDMTGRMLGFHQAAGDTGSIDVSALPAGMYLVACGSSYICFVKN